MKKGGFTLMEMLVVVAIFLIIMGVIMANLPEFRSRTELDLTMQEIATMIRQIQVYGTAGRGVLASERPIQGLYFSVAKESLQKIIIIFTDDDRDFAYTEGEKTGEFILPGNIIIEDICLYNYSGGEDCNVDSVDIVYSNPHVNPRISDMNHLYNYKKTVIKFSSAKLGATRELHINISGLVTVE